MSPEVMASDVIAADVMAAEVDDAELAAGVLDPQATNATARAHAGGEKGEALEHHGVTPS